MKKIDLEEEIEKSKLNSYKILGIDLEQLKRDRLTEKINEEINNTKEFDKLELLNYIKDLPDSTDSEYEFKNWYFNAGNLRTYREVEDRHLEEYYAKAKRKIRKQNIPNWLEEKKLTNTFVRIVLLIDLFLFIIGLFFISTNPFILIINLIIIFIFSLITLIVYPLMNKACIEDAYKENANPSDIKKLEKEQEEYFRNASKEIHRSMKYSTKSVKSLFKPSHKKI